MGLTVRDRLELVLRTTGWIPFMVTLTANPAWFASPEEAFWFMRRCINALVTELWRRNEGRRSAVCWMLSKRYYCGFEVHQSGWPHFHLLLDARFVDFHVIEAVWNRLGRRGGKPGMGIVFFTEKKRHWTIDMASRYVTKYLTKAPKGGWPAWVLHNKRRLARFTSSQGLNLLGLKKTAKRKQSPAQHEETCFCEACRAGQARRTCRERGTRCHAERMRRCGAESNVFVVSEEVRPDGEIIERRRFVARLADSHENVALMFGVIGEGGSAIRLGRVHPQVLQRLCDYRRLKRARAREELERKLSARRPKRQQDLIENFRAPDARWLGVGV